MSFGPANESSGALMSGNLKITILSETLDLQQVKMELLAHISTRRPIHPNCKACKSRQSIMKTWNFFEHTTTLRHGTHLYPFSYLFPGKLPATTSSALASIDYELVATIYPRVEQFKAMVANRPLKLARSILPGPDKTSQRVFPPTTLNALLTIPNMCNPGSHFMGSLAFTGIQVENKRWKLKKVNWRIDEISKCVSPACKLHKSRIPGNENQGGIEYTDTRIVGAGDIKEGWKTDWTAHENGRIEMEVEFSTHIAAKPACDVDDSGEDGSGIVVSHVMVVEAVVFEVGISGRPGNIVESLPNGSARVLRMQFPVIVTERSGLGISWDNEIPPMYRDIPAMHLPSYDQSKNESQEDLSALPSLIGRGSTPAPNQHTPPPGSSSQHQEYVSPPVFHGSSAQNYGASHLHQVNRSNATRPTRLG